MMELRDLEAQPSLATKSIGRRRHFWRDTPDALNFSRETRPTPEMY
jgi:hypothetical protein